MEFGIVGALGRMGRAIAARAVMAVETDFSPSLLPKLCVPIEYAAHPDLGKKYRDVTHIACDATIVSLAEAKIPAGGLIDFSHAATVIETLRRAAETGVPVVVGTTGFTNEQRKELENMATKIPLIIASNMAIGVNVLFALVEQAARALKDHGFAPEIMEIHHNLKKDSPSGTAVTMQEAIRIAYGFSENDILHGREGMVGERKKNELGVIALRGGDVVGDHTAYFLGQGERIEIKHQATNRDTFAAGALAALKFLQGKKPGLYSMKDVLGLRSN
ncbi:MAG: 4-hydroxy-tetrahydrodipicolinate reductase [Spirochaetes bacterium]|nr:4-hydroxy-tetrahydrodipicolinate reductase [Spirochaetota bacterium]